MPTKKQEQLILQILCQQMMGDQKSVYFCLQAKSLKILKMCLCNSWTAKIYAYNTKCVIYYYFFNYDVNENETKSSHYLLSMYV